MLNSGAKFDVVLLDVRLPDANGLEHISEIIKSPSLPEVIIITAFGSTEIADFALKSGALDYIDKPSSPELITLRLTRALEHHRTKMFWLKMKRAFEGDER
jgi:two-component system NtrC family response regulator